MTDTCALQKIRNWAFVGFQIFIDILVDLSMATDYTYINTLKIIFFMLMLVSHVVCDVYLFARSRGIPMSDAAAEFIRAFRKIYQPFFSRV